MPPVGYAVDWTAIVLAVVVGVASLGAMLGVAAVIAPRRPSAAKSIPYESGIEPTPLNWTQFNIRYSVFAILFLIFDVEAVFLFPWALVFLETATYVFYAMILFIAVLLFGVGYAWRKGVLEWR